MISQPSEPKREHRPLGVGYIDLREAALNGSFSMAASALDSMMQMMLAGRLNYIVLDGQAIRYRKARIRHYRFETKLDLADYPDD